jgi:hypothetical protein
MLFDLTGGVCFYCQIPLIEDSDDEQRYGQSALLMQIDHRTPTSRGGSDRASNRAPSCGPCNGQKHNRTVEEYRHYLRQHGIIASFFGERETDRDWLLVASWPPNSSHQRFARFANNHHFWGRG